MQQLLGDHAGTDESFMRKLFLPGNVRIVVAASPTITSLEYLAELADQVQEVAVPTVNTGFKIACDHWSFSVLCEMTTQISLWVVIVASQNELPQASQSN